MDKLKKEDFSEFSLTLHMRVIAFFDGSFVCNCNVYNGNYYCLLITEKMGVTYKNEGQRD